MLVEIFLPVIIVVIVGLIAGLLLGIVYFFVNVEENSKVAEILDVLPGANCGGCGYSGCEAYANALCEGETNVNLCTPGGAKTAELIASILGTDSGDVDQKVAYVKCNGDFDMNRNKLIYDGINTCRGASMFFGGKDNCVYACEGLGDCVLVCNFDAISIEYGVAKIDISKCVGCGLCVEQCPKNLIHLTTKESKALMLCSNKDKGSITRKVCNEGCIACGLCVRNCSYNAITIKNNMAVIDDDFCTACGECVKVCPVKVLKCI